MATSNQVEFETDSGNSVTVTAESGSIRVTVEGPSIAFEDIRATFGTMRGADILDCGRRRTKDGEKIRAAIPVEGHKADIEQLREDSKDDSPLTYAVEEYTKTSTAGGWGKREITKQRLSPSKSYSEMDDRERELDRQVDSENDVPDDAEPGDVLTPDDLLDDARTQDEKEQDALDEADETGEEVVISKTTTVCNDPSEECNLDYVTKVATPKGDVETRRTHTY